MASKATISRSASTMCVCVCVCVARFSLLWPGPHLVTIEVVGARRLSRIKRATWKGRNPRPGLALCMLLQTAVAAAETVIGSAVVPVALKC
jgi:hypothetical protein